MGPSAPFLNASAAARRLGVSVKALRLYEQRGLIAPPRTASGWRTYGPREMTRAAEIATLRVLGLSLAQIALVLNGDPQSLPPALAAHQTMLERERHALAEKIEKVRSMRAELDRGRTPAFDELARLMRPSGGAPIAFELPWPWGGERFELHDIQRLNFIVGPLFSGKTRLAHAITDNLPGSVFIGLERLVNDGADTRHQLNADPALKARVDETLPWLVGDAASASAALVALIAALESNDATALVIDMIEQGLDQPEQEALMTYLRRRGADAPPLFMLTRSCVILDLTTTGPNETIIFCPANHSPPGIVMPYPGAPGYEAVATCLASPAARARTAGVVAMRPAVA
ncbi:MAG: MerR family transcriptional regulator [Dongiaceae bacterium]